MRGVRNRRLILAVSAALGLGSVAVPAGAAGLFDAIASIFGGEPQSRDRAPVRQYFRYEDLEPIDPRPRPRRERPPHEAGRDARPVNTAIDPVKVPQWYLTDPTLRRGDIVVLVNGVFVFEGGSRIPYAPDDFVPLERSRLSAGERARIAAMAGYRPAAVTAGVPRATATAQAAELGVAVPVSR